MAGLDLLVIAVDSEIERMETRLLALAGAIKCVHEKRISERADIDNLINRIFRAFREFILIFLKT
jgi:hypothetical protein